MRKSLLGILFCLCIPSWAVNYNVVLVPGFFSKMTTRLGWGQYFSADIVATLEGQGHRVFVVDNLDPFGTLQINGELLKTRLIELRDSGALAEKPLVVVAHSAGGLYALYAQSELTDLKIERLITVSTPFEGLRVIESFNNPLMSWVFDLLQVEGLPDLAPSRVRAFLSRVRVPEGFRVQSYAGLQIPGPSSQAQFLSWPMRIAQLFIRRPSDGIVAVDSTQGENTEIQTTGASTVRIEAEPTPFPLEHWEQVLNADEFAKLGVRNLEYIRTQQIEFYSHLIQ